MGEPERIKRTLETAFSGPSWHGPSLLENLRRVSAETARAKPLAGAHSIWEIANHLLAWQKFTLRVLDGATYATLQGADDWPAPAGDWENVVKELESTHAEICNRVASLSQEFLKENVPGADYPWRVLFRGIASHSLYHAGQIGLLKK